MVPREWPSIVAIVGSEHPSVFAVVAKEWRNVCSVTPSNLARAAMRPHARESAP
jgi:hypothetical protein